MLFILAFGVINTRRVLLDCSLLLNYVYETVGQISNELAAKRSDTDLISNFNVSQISRMKEIRP